MIQRIQTKKSTPAEKAVATKEAETFFKKEEATCGRNPRMDYVASGFITYKCNQLFHPKIISQNY